MEKFRWAYIGNGNIAKSTAMAVTKGDHEIVAVYGRNEKKARRFAKRYGARTYADFESAVNSDSVDGVYIATPHTSHVDYAIRAMELKKPVLCEKPVATSAKEVERLIAASDENGVYFAEAMWTWFSNVALKVKNWVQRGEIGDVKTVEINYAFPGLMMNKESRVLTPETAGGALLDIGVYPITYCYNLFGYPKRITCNGTIKDGIDIEETVILEYKKKLTCTLIMSFSNLKESCIIRGTKGEIEVPFFHMAKKAILRNESGQTVFRGKTDYLIEFTRAAKEIRSGKTDSAYVPHSATLDCMKIMDECRRQMKLVYPFEEEDNGKGKKEK